MADLKISQLNSLAGASLANNDVLAVVDTSASETKKITSKELVQYGYGLIDASTLDGDVIEPGTTSARGTVQLTDSTGSTSITTAATANAVKTSYDLANAALPKSGGTMTGAILADDSTSAATPGYAFDGDPNTGLLRTGADELALVTGGNTRLTIDASGNVVVPGNFTVSGTTTTIDTTTLVVEDKNIDIGVVTSPTDVTADGGGITLKGTTDKEIKWLNGTGAWTFTEHVNIATAKEYRIAGVKVLDATSLGSAVVSSSLTSVGTISTGTWSASTIAVNKGGTGQTSYTDGQLLIGNTTGNTLTKSTLTAGAGISITNGSGSITIANSGGTVTSVSGTSPISVANGTTTPAISIQSATTTQSGAVQLTDSTSSTSTTTAATPNAVKTAYDLANAALPKSGGALTGDVTLNAQTDLRFADADSSNWVAFQAPATITTNVTWTLPATDGSNGQVLSTNGTGTLSWATAATGDAVLSAANAFTGANTFTNSTGQTYRRAATQDGILLRGRAGGTSSYTVELTPTTLTASRTLTAPDTSLTLAGTDIAQSFSAAQRGSVSALTSAATVTPDFAVANNFSLTLGINLTIANPTNLTAGQSGAIVITQGASTAYTVAFGSNWKFSGGTPTMSTGLSSVSTLVYYVESASRITAQLLTNVA